MNIILLAFNGYTVLKNIYLGNVLGLSCGEGNDSLLQYSCLENPGHRGVCWAVVHRVTQGWTRLKRLSMHACTGLSCATLDLWRARGLLSSCGTGLIALPNVGSYFPDQGLNPSPLHCKEDS